MKRAPLIGGIVAPTTDSATVTVSIDAAGEVTFRRVEVVRGNDHTDEWTMRTRGRHIEITVREKGERMHGTKENGMVADTMREIAAVMLARG